METDKTRTKTDKQRERETDEDRGNHTPFGPAVAGLALTTAVQAWDTVSS